MIDSVINQRVGSLPARGTHEQRTGREETRYERGEGNVLLTDCAMLAKIRIRTRPRQSSFKVLPAIYHWPH